MDKYEYKLKLDQLKNLVDQKDYRAAAEIANKINWKKVRNSKTLLMVADIYAQLEQYETCKDVLLQAYEHSSVGRNIVSYLVEIAIKSKNVEEAEGYYNEFLEISPNDNQRYVIAYEIACLKDSPLSDRIAILEEFKEKEYTETWAFELAALYGQADMREKCVATCDELVLWFGEGDYVEKALDLKRSFQPLTPEQEAKYQKLRSKRGVVEINIPKKDDPEVSGDDDLPEIKVTASRFNTQNLQEELAEGMQQIIDATERETVSDTINNIKKIVQNIPYLQASPRESEKEGAIESGESDGGTDMRDFPDEGVDDRGNTRIPESTSVEFRADDRMSIEDVLDEWEKTKYAAEAAIEAAEKRQLDIEKKQALDEASGILRRLQELFPLLTATPGKDIPEEPETVGATLVPNGAAAEDSDDLSAQAGVTDEPLARMGVADEPLARMGAADEPLARMGEEDESSGPGESEEGSLASSPGADSPPASPPDAGSLAAAEEAGDDGEPVEAEAERGESIIGEPGAPGEKYAPGEALSMLEKEEARLKENKFVTRQLSVEEVFDTSDDVDEAARFGLSPEKEAMEKTQPFVLHRDMTGGLAASGRDKRKTATRDKPSFLLDVRQDGVMTEETREMFSYFLPIPGMREQIERILEGASSNDGKAPTSLTGNLAVEGEAGSGKTVLATTLIKAIQRIVGNEGAKIGKIGAQSLNKRKFSDLVPKIEGGYLLIERAGELTEETARGMSEAMEENTQGMLVILEDDSDGIQRALSLCPSLAEKFTGRIQIPIFSVDELVDFGKSYAHEMECVIDQMGILALYNRITNIQKLEHPTTLGEVKSIVDEAIESAESGKTRGVFTKKYNDNDYLILHEKDFGEV